MKTPEHSGAPVGQPSTETVLPHLCGRDDRYRSLLALLFWSALLPRA